MIRTLLIANRGEIARRIARTAAEMGIESVAVYTEADANAPFVREAARAVPVRDYLDIEAVLDAARSAGADAVHPGYGFLSENPEFSSACRDRGIRFVGPPPEAMRALGNKSAARALAEKSGVPVVPGNSGATDAAAAAAVGYPLLIKAADGGGGKGMRLVARKEEFAAALESARREAKAAFGSDAVLLEKLVRPARHIEVQFLADSGGAVVAVGERECSVQRRHQKIIEECPSPMVDAALRARLSEAAVKLARAAGYVNAGTCEFLVDADRNFYFLEVNARLQVEHPVTEMVYGVDLVRLQIKIAAGEALPASAGSLVPRGHAIEARVCAEDPANGFLPAPGPILVYREPAGPGIRVDSGVEDGSEVSERYDPLIAKTIACGEDRPAALARLRRALREMVILGTATNLDYVGDVLAHPAFAAGDLHTGFLDEHLAGWTPRAPHDSAVFAVAAAAFEMRGSLGVPSDRRDGASEWNPWRTLAEWGRGGRP